METAESNALEPAPARPSTLAEAYRAAIGLLAGEGFGVGDRAALRRITPEAPYTPALWKVLIWLEDHGYRPIVEGRTTERDWAVLLSVAAHLVSPGQNLHQNDVPLGRALAEIGWSRLRLDSLLRARGAMLEVLLRRMTRYLASKSRPCNLVDIGQLLFNQEGQRADDVRLSVARSYFRTLYTLEGEQS